MQRNIHNISKSEDMKPVLLANHPRRSSLRNRPPSTINER